MNKIKQHERTGDPKQTTHLSASPVGPVNTCYEGNEVIMWSREASEVIREEEGGWEMDGRWKDDGRGWKVLYLQLNCTNEVI